MEYIDGERPLKIFVNLVRSPEGFLTYIAFALDNRPLAIDLVFKAIWEGSLQAFSRLREVYPQSKMLFENLCKFEKVMQEALIFLAPQVALFPQHQAMLKFLLSHNFGEEELEVILSGRWKGEERFSRMDITASELMSLVEAINMLHTDEILALRAQIPPYIGEILNETGIGSR